MNTERIYTEEEIRLCPHLQKKVVQDSPFKEKIKMSSYTEETPRKKSFSDEEKPAQNSCPYKQKMAENIPTSAKQESSDDEDEQFQGGCPVMSSNPKKCNPGLFIPEIIDSNIYISPFMSVLESNNIFGRKNKDSNLSKNWDNYPIFLKHTLLYFGENYDKYRSIEVGYKFFITDDLREKGNKLYKKKNFAEALSNYEKAVSILRWLECTPDEFVQKLKSFPKINQEMMNFSENMTVEELDKLRKKRIESLKTEKKEQEKKEQEKMNTKTSEKQNFDERLNDLLLTSFTDENVKLCTGPELKDKADVDIYENILFQLYSNMAMCYLQMTNLKEARQAITEMEKIKVDSSIFLFRQAQIIAADRRATFEELLKAKANIKKALELKKTEKIYEHTTNFLKIFSLENHETIFEEMKQFLDKRIIEQSTEIKDVIHKVLLRVKQIERAEKDIISRGLIPQEGSERTLLIFSKDENFESKLLRGLIQKYKQAIFFFASSEKEEDSKQVEIAQRCLVKIKILRDKFNLIWNLDFNSKDHKISGFIRDLNVETSLNWTEDKVYNRVKRTQREQARDIIENYQFDLQVFEVVVQEIFKEEEDRKKQIEKEKAMEAGINNDVEVQVSGKSNALFLLQMIALALFVLAVLYISKKYVFGREVLSKI